MRTVMSVRGCASVRAAMLSTTSVNLWYIALDTLPAAVWDTPERRFWRFRIPESSDREGGRERGREQICISI